MNIQNPQQKREEKTKGKGKKPSIFSFSLLTELAIEMAVIFALPLIGAVYLGKWLNKKYDSETFLIVLVLLAIALSWYVVIKKILAIKNLINK